MERKKAVVNIENGDNKCFKWSVTRALNSVLKNPKRVTTKLVEQSRRLNWNGLTFPVELKDIEKFEKNNPGICINVFGFGKNVYPLRVSKVKGGRYVDLLLISDEEKKHFCVIKNLSRLLSSQLSGKEHEKFVCRRRLNYFSSEEKLETHLEI